MEVDKLKINRKTEETFYKKKKRQRYISRSLIALIVIFLIFSLYRSGVFSPSIKVEIAAVTLIYPYQAKTLLNATGYVVAEKKAAVASKGAGRLEYLAVEEGDEVKKGSIIARLENKDVSAALRRTEANCVTAGFLYNQAKAEFEDAMLDYERKKKLAESGTIPSSIFDIASARLDGAKAALQSAESGITASVAAVSEAKEQFENTIILAPFNGTILTKNADVGEIVAPFASSANSRAAVVTMADMNSLIVEADVSENNINLVEIGQPCIITLDAYPESKYRGIVHKIVPTADRAKATILTKVAFIDRDNKVLPEMSARVSFLKGEIPEGMISTSKKVVSANAVAERNGRQVVFLADDKTASEQTVETGEQFGDFVEILNGPEPGAKVILNPLSGLRDKARIEIKE